MDVKHYTASLYAVSFKVQHKRHAMEKVETPSTCLCHFGVISFGHLNFSTAPSNLNEIFPRLGGGGGYMYIRVVLVNVFVFLRLHAYTHTFHYPNADIGLNNRPCRNVPLKCKLCHPSLEPVTGKKSRTTPPFIDAVWHYNMIQHLEEVHPQYAHPENLIGHPLPAQILNSFVLTALEQEDANILMSRWLMPLFEGDKENVQVGSGSHKQKTISNGNSANAKKACKST
ncbi:hypothetical protein EDB19DRAFT_1835242 [Suillus lakei]|nr:hypothetical protein EDB19DRAFT_1835242 [Suillus lakei]